MGYGSGAALSPIWDVFKKDPVLKRDRMELDPSLAAYYRDRSAGLAGAYSQDQADTADALRAYKSTLPGLDKSYAADQSFLESTRPGGAQERRFSDMIRGYMDQARAASQVGLDQAKAEQKAKLAAGGNSAFADSSYRARQAGLLQSNNEVNLAREGAGLQLNNANQFLRSYKPGASLALAGDRTRYAMTPLQVRGAADQLGAARASGVEQGLRGVYDDFYHYQQPKNWATYVDASEQAVANLYHEALSSYSAFGGGGGLGGAGGGGGGGGGAPYGGGGGGYGSSGAYGGGFQNYLGSFQ